MRKFYLFFFFSLVSIALFSQADRWQQAADYTMTIDFDVETHQFTGQQTIVYTNNSPDRLNRAFYHLYFNAFQPNSMMDVRSRTIADPDRRVRDRILGLSETEIGYQKIKSLKQDGVKCKFKVVGTILEVDLAKAIAPGSQTTLVIEFEAQVPIQIRRSGRNSREGIDYSMTQWYPKLCEYDYQGWHANPYVAREFHGVWGNFDVTITIDRNYILGASGVLQNPNEIGHGYAEKGATITPPKGNKLSWNFLAKNVHDFAWAADPDYTHEIKKMDDGTVFHFLYQKTEDNQDAWAQLPDMTNTALNYINKKFGKYPYPVYSIIQGGDGGMEYPMATLITGNRPIASLLGVTVHELFHSWYQMILGTNESLYPWMDEGFTSYGSNLTMQHVMDSGSDRNPHAGSYFGYKRIVESGLEEPMTTHSDHYSTNSAYGTAAYSKGAVFLHQLSYIIGQAALDRGMLSYFNTWKFKHPNVNDFIRIMEKESGLELDWYKEYWVHTTHTIDYGIKNVEADGASTNITMERLGKMPMPIDLIVTRKNGKKEHYYFPMRIMRGEKTESHYGVDMSVEEDWPWTHPTYDFVIPCKLSKIEKIEIDPSERMADLDRKNNVYPMVEEEEK